MSQIADASYIGKGEIFLGPYAGGAAMVSIGNVAELTFSHGTEKKELLDYTSAGGGKANSIERITVAGRDFARFNRHRLVDHAALRRVIAHFHMAGNRKILAERMAD